MTHTALQAVLALTGAVLSIGVALYGLAIAPRHFVHRTFAIALGCLALMQLGAGLSAQSVSASSVWYGERLRLLATACLPGVGLLFSVAFARFNPREHVRPWRWAIPIALGWPLGLVVVHQMHLQPLDWAGYGFYLFVLVGSVAILAQLEKTLRASAGSIRAQIKFVVLGLGCVFAAQVYTASQTLLLASRPASLMAVEATAAILANVFMLTAFTRQRRFDVQLYVARSFPFHAVSLKAAILYLLLAGGLPSVFRVESGGNGALWGFGLLAGALVVLISDLVRYQSRRFLNRYVFRTRYDYRRIWTLYTQRMASVVEVRELCNVIARGREY